MTNNLWVALVCLAYAALYLVIITLIVRRNRKNQWWKHEDDIDPKSKEK